MFRNQLAALITHERITTTVAKAKELRPIAERAVTLARTGTLANRRLVLEMLPEKGAVQRLFEEIAPRFADRPGGYTRIVRVGRRRGDNAELALIEFVDYQPTFDEGDSGSGKPSLMDRAKGMFGGRKTEVSEEIEAEQAEPAMDEAAGPDEVAAAGPESVDDEPSEAEGDDTKE
jgi:large subunit ribosomal protein L17